ncbi:MAG: HupE/UreJ family protein [Moraxellaceae bacterium]|nr:HupE/UreJ family protein [Moraxellaceae bacterium]
MPLLAQAHLMVAQRGTLNLVDDGAYMVLSVPVSAFIGVDDNQDGLLSLHELEVHQSELQQQIMAGVSLRHQTQALPLQGIMLSLSPEHTSSNINIDNSNAEQLIVLGRFALAEAKGQALNLSLTLFGKASFQQQMNILVTQAQNKNQLIFTPSNTQSLLFASRASIFTNYVVLGVEHILTGFDHLLFLLVLLMTGGRIGQLLLVLTAFTVGHALTLGASVVYGISLPATLVEPMIAASILLMALFEKLKSSLATSHFLQLRLGLVFSFALIHGFGFASSLTALGLDKNHLLVSLLGFNVGIEVGQMLFAGLVLVAATLILKMLGQARLNFLRIQLIVAAMGISSVWFLYRVTVLKCKTRLMWVFITLLEAVAAGYVSTLV